MAGKYFVMIPGSPPAEIVEFKYHRHRLKSLRIRWSNINPDYIKTIPYHPGLKIVGKRPPLELFCRRLYRFALKWIKAAYSTVKGYFPSENK